MMKHVLAAGLIILTGCILYWNTLNAPFFYDDRQAITENPHMYNPSDLKAFFDMDRRFNYTKTRFFLFLTFAWDYQRGRGDPLPFHVTNTGIHIGSALLLYFLVLSLSMTPMLKHYTGAGGKYFLAIVTSLVFLAHPLATEPVNYIYQRAEALALLFCLLTVLCFLRARLLREKGVPFRTPGHLLFLAGSLLAFFLGVFTKETLMTVPALFLLIEFFCFPIRGESIPRRIGYILIYCLPLLPLFKYMDILDRATDTISRQDYFLTQMSVIRTYLRLLFIPAGQNIDHAFPLVTSFFNLQTLISFVFLCGLLLLIPCLFNRQRFLSLSIAWFFIQLSPSSSIQPILTLICEYRVYAALPGFSLFLAILLSWLIPRRNLRVATAILLVAALSSTTIFRNRVWQSRISLWEDTVSKSPDLIRPRNNLGVAYRDAGLSKKARKEFLEVLKLDPEDVHALNNLATIEHQAGRMDEAEKLYRRVLSIDPERTEIYFNLGLLALAREDYANAEDAFRKTLAAGIEHADIHVNLGFCYARMDRFSDALREYQTALVLDPEYKMVNLHKKIGILLYMKGRIDEAEESLKRALVKSPDDSLIHANLGTVLVAREKFTEALEHFNRAIALDAADAESYFNAGYIYYHRTQDMEKARSYLERCLELRPDHPGRDEIEQILSSLEQVE